MSLLPGVLARNWKLKLAAFALALFLWGGVRVAAPNREYLPAPVTVSVDDPEWALVGEPQPDVVSVRFGGPTRELFRLAVEGTQLRVPVRSVSSADTTILLRPDWIPAQGRQGVTVQDIRPASVRLRFEPVETRTVPVAFRMEGSLPDDRALLEPIGLTPSLVRITGRRSRLVEVDSVATVPLNLDEVRRSGSVTLDVDTSGLADLAVNPPDVTVRVSTQEAVERVFEDLPVRMPGEAGGNLRVGPDTVRVRVRGARTLVERVDPARLTVSVPPEAVEGLGEGEERRVPLRIEGVPELLRATAGPDSVTVRREERP